MNLPAHPEIRTISTDWHQASTKCLIEHKTLNSLKVWRLSLHYMMGSLLWQTNKFWVRSRWLTTTCPIQVRRKWHRIIATNLTLSSLVVTNLLTVSTLPFLLNARESEEESCFKVICLKTSESQLWYRVRSKTWYRLTTERLSSLH
jgi:hypothetical protein